MTSLSRTRPILFVAMTSTWIACSKPVPAPAPGGGPAATTQPPAAAAAPAEAPGGAPEPHADPASIDALKRIVSNEPGSAAHAPAAAPVARGPLPVADLILTPPDDWRPGQPTSAMRRAQYEVPGVDPTAPAGEAVVFFFGQGQGGGVEDNIARWVGQLTPEAGQSGVGQTRDKREVGGVKISIVKARGTYDPGMAMGTASRALAGYALVGIILESAGGPVFVKITGPAATIDAATPAIEKLVASVRIASGGGQ